MPAGADAPHAARARRSVRRTPGARPVRGTGRRSGLRRCCPRNARSAKSGLRDALRRCNVPRVQAVDLHLRRAPAVRGSQRARPFPDRGRTSLRSRGNQAPQPKRSRWSGTAAKVRGRHWRTTGRRPPFRRRGMPMGRPSVALPGMRLCDGKPSAVSAVARSLTANSGPWQTSIRHQ